MTTPTLRRLDDRERYWGLTWPGWLAAAPGPARCIWRSGCRPSAPSRRSRSPCSCWRSSGMVLYGVSGQALSPGRQLLAIISYRRSAKLLALADRAERRGLVLDAAPRADRRRGDYDRRNDDRRADVRATTAGRSSDGGGTSRRHSLGPISSVRRADLERSPRRDDGRTPTELQRRATRGRIG